MGNQIRPLGIRSLLVHTSDRGVLPTTECGWGRIKHNLDDIVICEDGLVRVIYQGEISPGSYMRVPVPMPNEPLTGMVTISASFCFASETDPAHPDTYSRAGLDVTFRPHSQKFKDEKSTHAKSHAFFRKHDFMPEADLRHDAHKWDTVMHRSKRFQPATLHNPLFDIHYNARQCGANAREPDRIPYALTVSLHAPKMPKLYDLIVARYRTILQPIQPVVEIPVRVS